MLAAVHLGLRGFQILFSIVVLGLAATLIAGQVYGDSPVTTRYSTFTGGLGIIVGAVGVAGLFITAIPELVVLALDALAGIFFIAGGIAWAVGLKGVSCSVTPHSSVEDLTNAYSSPLINQGQIQGSDNFPFYGVDKDAGTAETSVGRLNANCKKGVADEVFQFLCFALAIGLIALGYVRMKKGGKVGSSSYVA